MAIYLPKLLNPLLARYTVARGLATFSDSPSSKSGESSQYDYDDEAVLERDFADMKTEDFRELYEQPDVLPGNQDPQSIKKQIDIILNEYEHLKYNSMGRVPSSISVVDMRRILEEGTNANLMNRMFNYFFKKEMSKRSSGMRRFKEKELIQERLSKKFKEMEERLGKEYRTGLSTEDGQLLYGLWHNSLVCRIPEVKLKQHGSDSDLIHAALYGKKVVFDFSYDSFMNVQTIRSSAEQLQDSYGINKFQYKQPFDFWFCNFNENSVSGKYMVESCLRNLYTSSMITVKQDCFTNHFDKSRLVYLSPDSKQNLTDVNNDDVYVIGVYNDKGKAQPLSLRRAEKMGIRCRRLPLDDHVAWQGGSKSLCINHVVGSLLEVSSNGGDWRKAFLKWLPSRKLKTVEQLREEERRRLGRFRLKKPSFNVKRVFDL